MTQLQKEELKRISRRKDFDPDEYGWCTYFKKWLPKDQFYKNCTHSNGLQSECKIVSKARSMGVEVEFFLADLSSKEKRLYA